MIKYRLEDHLGEMVDAVFAPTSVDALYAVTRGPVKPGECFRAFEAMGPAQLQKAIALYQERRKADRAWNLLLKRIEEDWANAVQKARQSK